MWTRATARPLRFVAVASRDRRKDRPSRSPAYPTYDDFRADRHGEGPGGHRNGTRTIGTRCPPYAMRGAGRLREKPLTPHREASGCSSRAETGASSNRPHSAQAQFRLVASGATGRIGKLHNVTTIRRGVTRAVPTQPVPQRPTGLGSGSAVGYTFPSDHKTPLLVRLLRLHIPTGGPHNYISLLAWAWPRGPIASMALVFSSRSLAANRVRDTR